MYRNKEINRLEGRAREYKRPKEIVYHPDIPIYTKETKSQGFTNFGFIKLADAFLILTFDEGTYLNVFQADENMYQLEKEQENNSKSIEMSMSHINVKDLNILQFGIESPETKNLSRFSKKGDRLYQFFTFNGFKQIEEETSISAEIVHDLFYSKKEQGLPDNAGFFEFKPGLSDSVIAATFNNHIKKDSATIFIIQPEKESSPGGITQYNSQRGLKRLFENILEKIKSNSTPAQDKVEIIIDMAIKQGFVDYEVPETGIDQKRFNEILTLIWQITALIDTGEIESKKNDWFSDKILRDLVPWVAWGEFSPFKKWMYKNQPRVTLRAKNWQELLIAYPEFRFINYDLKDVDNINNIDSNKFLIANLEQKVAELLGDNAISEQYKANRLMQRAIKNGDIRFENDDSSAHKQERNYIYTLVWRIEVLTRVYQVGRIGKLADDKELTKLLPWIKWDSMDKSVVGRAAKLLYKDPSIILKEAKWEPIIERYKKEFGIKNLGKPTNDPRLMNR